MGKIIIKWFLATIFVGLIPMLIRVFLYVIMLDPGPLRIVTISDILVWGLVLNVSIFNERERFFNYNPKISSVSSTVSVVLIVIFSLLFAFELINEAKSIFKPYSILSVGVFFSIVTLITFIVYMVNINPFPEKENDNSKGVY